MGGGTRKRGGIISDINVTPLVDIMLVLLIIFMLTASVIARQAIEVELPKAATGSTPPPTTLAVTLSREGKLFLNGEAIGPNALRNAVAVAVKKDSKAQAIIAADKMTSHGRVVWVIDVVKHAGIASFAINIDPGALMPPDEGDGADKARAED